jgi:hypothetical protein
MRLAASLAILLVACADDTGISRADSPLASVESAKLALARKDIPRYVDALTEPAARRLMANSVAICLSKNHPVAAAKLNPSLGCEGILEKYGWPAGEAKSPEAFREAVSRVRDPRGLAAELETNHRKYRAGSSFVWEHMDSLKVRDLVVRGGSAKGMADWGSGLVQPISFQRDDTGWRYDDMLDEK